MEVRAKDRDWGDEFVAAVVGSTDGAAESGNDFFRFSFVGLAVESHDAVVLGFGCASGA
jgi:hypothetical protein